MSIYGCVCLWSLLNCFHLFIYLLNNTIEKKKCSNMYSRSGQQGKGTDSCPEITELHKNYNKQKLNPE